MTLNLDTYLNICLSMVDKKLSLLIKNDVTTQVKISDSVINIGSSSFNGFSNLKKVKINPITIPPWIY